MTFRSPPSDAALLGTSSEMNKNCFKCGELKPMDSFYKHEAMADGHLNKCKECTKKDVRTHRGLNAESVRAYDRARSSLPHRRDKNRELSARFREASPERRKAQVILGNAVRSGKVQKLPCFVCGEKAEAHHPDYSAPLDVVWLCPAHHKQAHAMLHYMEVLP